MSNDDDKQSTYNLMNALCRAKAIFDLPDGKFFNWLLFNRLSKISKCIFNRMVYENKVQRITVL